MQKLLFHFFGSIIAKFDIFTCDAIANVWRACDYCLQHRENAYLKRDHSIDPGRRSSVVTHFYWRISIFNTNQMIKDQFKTTELRWSIQLFIFFC